ncbi:hypothetical protein [Lacinutrix jangbogonensis]|uniref:hypothetical protein n=1 Tax=Lacinutrix jangbogonensis TaxID=1469557 RepID=UPI00053CF4F8|nr:hypothetical protein [Lacinutrix jangbogonensis]
MKSIKHLSKYVPHIYFTAIIVYWFLDIRNNEGASPYLILLLVTPFIWQLIKPNRVVNIILGSLFICLSFYLVLAYLSDVIKITEVSANTSAFLIIGGLFVLSNLMMSIWMFINGIKAKS